MKATHDETYPPTISETPPLQKSRRSIAAAAIVVAVLAAGAVGRYSADAPAKNSTAPGTAPQPTATQRTTQTSTPTRDPAVVGTAGADLTQSQLRLDAESKLGINLDAFSKAEQDFLIALAAGGELSRVVSR